MASDEQRLQIWPAPGSLSDIMVRGNMLLSTGKTAEAINYYTHVLHKLSPGHVCAFLNRSIAYLEEGCYELAVMDAHRAKIAVDEMRNSSQVTNRLGTHIVRFMRVERLHVDADHAWTQKAHRYRGEGWARSPLASIVINATPDTNVKPYILSKDKLIRTLTIRATYRLCGALFMVGDGARKDALDLIENIRLTMQDDSWESREFNKLGNEILGQVVSEVDPIDPVAIRLLGDDTKEKRDERMKKVTENMKATTTRYGYGDYRWNSYEPKFGVADWQTLVQAWVGSRSDKCSAAIVHPERTEGTQAKGIKPYVELRANQDIKSGDLVLLSERNFTSVTTSDPEKARKNRLEGILDHFYCNNCATLLAVPLRLVKQHEEAQKAAQSRVPPVFPATGTAAAITSAQSSSPHLTQPPPGQAFEICSPDRLVPTCSGTCRDLKNDFDVGVCGTTIARQLCIDHLHYLNPRPITDRKTLCLRDLIFLRAIIIAINYNQNPLNIHTIMYATSGPNARNIPITEIDPWSYTSHVVRPINYLQRLLADTTTDQWILLSQLDGWIIHALLAKISKAMRVSTSPHYAKVYSTENTIIGAFGPEHPRWDLVTQILKDKIVEEKNDEPVWSAGIDSLRDLIRVADPAKGESPNVEVVQKEGLSVVAVKKQGGGEQGSADPAIKAGEPLLRAGDEGDREGADLEMRDEEEEQKWYASWFDEMMHDRFDELDEGDEEEGETADDGDEEMFVDEGEDVLLEGHGDTAGDAENIT